MAQVKKKKKKQTEAQRLAHRDAVIAHADNKFVAQNLLKRWTHSFIQRIFILPFINSWKKG